MFGYTLTYIFSVAWKLLKFAEKSTVCTINNPAQTRVHRAEVDEAGGAAQRGLAER